MASIIPIQDLDTSSSPPADRSIRAVVTLSWPYSSSSRQCALLLADPDFRLRSREGQVRVVFRGAAARAVAERRLGIGDSVVLNLEGSKWANGVSTVHTPGKSVGELEYGGAVKLKLVRQGREDEEVEVQADVVNGNFQNLGKGPEATPSKRPSAVENFRASFGSAPEKSPGVYSSPAFFRKSRFSELEGLDRLFGEDLDAQGSPKKRARVSIGGVRDWRVVSRTPSPVKAAPQTFAPPTAEEANSMLVDEDTGKALESPSSSPTPAAALPSRIIDFGSKANTQKRSTYKESVANSISESKVQKPTQSPLEQLAISALESRKPSSQLSMAPPSLPRLQVPSTSLSPERSEGVESENPLTPRLQPVSSTALPLPSPFPVENAASKRFPPRGELPDISAEDEVEVIDARPSRSSQRRENPDTYQNNVVIPSSPRRTEVGAQDDDLDQVDVIGVDDAYIGETLTEEDDEDGFMHMDDVEEEIDPGELEGSEPGDYDEVKMYGETTDSESEEDDEGSLQPLREPIELSDSGHEVEEDRTGSVLPMMSASQLLSAQLNAGEAEEHMELASQAPATEGRASRLSAASFAKDTTQTTPLPVKPIKPSRSTLPTAGPGADKPARSTTQTPISRSPSESAQSPVGRAAPVSQSLTIAQVPAFKSGWGLLALESTAPMSLNTHWGFPSAESPIVKSRETADDTPQSERDRALKGTFRSLFGFQPSPSPTKDDNLGFARDEEDNAIPQLDGPVADLSSENAEIQENRPLTGLPLQVQKPTFDPLQQSPSHNPRSSAQVIDLGGSRPDVKDDDDQLLQPEQPSNEPMIVSPEVAALENQHSPRLDIEAVIGTPVPETASLDPFIVVGPEEQRRRSEHAVLDEESIAAREESRLASPSFPRDDASAVMEDAYGPASPGRDSDVLALLPDDGDSVVSTHFLAQQSDTPRAPIELQEDDNKFAEPEAVGTASAVIDPLHATTAQTTIPSGSSFRMLSSSPAVVQAAASVMQEQPSDDIEMLDMSQAEPDYWTQPAQTQHTIQRSQQSQQAAVNDSVDSPRNSNLATDNRPMSRDTVEDFDLLQASQVSRASAREVLDPRVSFMGTRRAAPQNQGSEQLENLSQAAATPQRRRLNGFIAVPQTSLGLFSGSQALTQDERDNDMIERLERRLDEVEAIKAEAARAEAAEAEEARRESIRTWAAEAEVDIPQDDNEPGADVDADAEPAVATPLLQAHESSLQSRDDMLKRLFGISNATQSAASEADGEPSQNWSLGESQADASYPRLPITPSFSQSQSARFEAQLPNPEAFSGEAPGELPLTPQLTQRESDLQAASQVSTQETNILQSQANQTPAEDIIAVDAMAVEKQETMSIHPLPTQPGIQEQSRPQIANAAQTASSEPRESAPSEKQVAPETPRRRSLRSRLSNVPDVISAWFSPKRSSTVAPIVEEQVTNEQDVSVATSPTRRKANGVHTAHAYFTKLSSLERHLNPRGSQSYGNQAGLVDVLAVVTDNTKGPQRAKGGPRDYFTVFHITDRSLPALTNISVEVYRPWKAVLPAADVGDVVLLRSFAVKSRHRKPYLLSTDASAWCVWRFTERAGTGEIVEASPPRKRSSDGGVREEVKGPPIEYGDGEREQADEMRAWWVHLENTVLATSDAEGKET